MAYESLSNSNSQGQGNGLQQRSAVGNHHNHPVFRKTIQTFGLILSGLQQEHSGKQMTAEELFRANLKLVGRIVGGVCRRSGLRGADAEDFGSAVNLALMENDFAILRAYEGRSSLATFLTVVIQRLLAEERRRSGGSWHASADARRLGDAAVLLEELLVRDGRSLDDALPLVRAVDPSLDRAAVDVLATRLPRRAPRVRFVGLSGDDDFVSSERADARARDTEARRTSARAGRVICETLAAFPVEERMLIRFRFGEGLSIADTARLLGLPQRPLYRRVKALLRQLRAALEKAGVTAASVEEVIAAAATEGIDFDLDGKNDAPRGSNTVECRP